LPELHCRASAVQVAPFACAATQCPLELQYAVAMQPLSFAHVEGQLFVLPSQT
jgi:hypothetical protein